MTDYQYNTEELRISFITNIRKCSDADAVVPLIPVCNVLAAFVVFLMHVQCPDTHGIIIQLGSWKTRHAMFSLLFVFLQCVCVCVFVCSVCYLHPVSTHPLKQLDTDQKPISRNRDKK